MPKHNVKESRFYTNTFTPKVSYSFIQRPHYSIKFDGGIGISINRDFGFVNDTGQFMVTTLTDTVLFVTDRFNSDFHRTFFTAVLGLKYHTDISRFVQFNASVGRRIGFQKVASHDLEGYYGGVLADPVSRIAKGGYMFIAAGLTFKLPTTLKLSSPMKYASSSATRFTRFDLYSELTTALISQTIGVDDIYTYKSLPAQSFKLGIEYSIPLTKRLAATLGLKYGQYYFDKPFIYSTSAASPQFGSLGPKFANGYYPYLAPSAGLSFLTGKFIQSMNVNAVVGPPSFFEYVYEDQNGLIYYNVIEMKPYYNVIDYRVLRQFDLPHTGMKLGLGLKYNMIQTLQARGESIIPRNSAEAFEFTPYKGRWGVVLTLGK